MNAATLRQDTGRRTIMPELGEPIEVRNLAARIKNHTLQNLDGYLEQLVTNVRANGGQVHFAQTAEQARSIIKDIATETQVKTIVKSKSMATEEIELNETLEEAGFTVDETDLGEYILQLAHEKPSHIVTPVLHKTREDIGKLFAEKLGIEYTSDPETLTRVAREVLREKFKNADMGITGANFAIAESGTICIVTNEGNGRLTTSAPRVLVSLMGMEKVIPRMRDLPVFLKVLGKSATGQRITCYTNLITGPKRADDADGPAEYHLVILDEGRSRILASDYRDALRCIRCGACLNACPVYRKLGGHAYESVYPGPIGKVITPLLKDMALYEHLPQACSLCEACLEACPERINLPSLLLHMRGELAQRGRMPFLWRMGFKGWRLGMTSKTLYSWGSWGYRQFMRLLAKDGWCRWMPSVGAIWTRYRDLPVLDRQPFHRRWARLQRELKSGGSQR